MEEGRPQLSVTGYGTCLSASWPSQLPASAGSSAPSRAPTPSVPSPVSDQTPSACKCVRMRYNSKLAEAGNQTDIKMKVYSYTCRLRIPAV